MVCVKAWDEKSYPEKRDIIQHLFNVNYNNTKIFNFEFSVILSEELEWFQRLIIVYCIFFLVLIWNWMIGWIRLLMTTLCGVHSLTCVTLVCLSCEISVLCFINQGPQCRLVLLFNFLRNPVGQKEFGVPRAIVSSILVFFWIVEKVWIGNFLLLISEGFSLKAHTLLSVIWGQLASSNLLVEYVPTRNPRIKFILVIFSFSDW